MPKLIKAIQHNLTPDQLNELKERFNVNETDIVDIKDIVSPELYQNLIQTPGDEMLILKTTTDFLISILEFAKNNNDVVYLLLPIGSPALMFKIAQEIPRKFIILFSHSERITEEKQQPDGSVIKQSVFKHRKFIVIL